MKPHVRTLELEIDAVTLAALDPACRIAVARACGNAAPNVVWASIRPALWTQVTWDDDVYGIHACAVPAAPRGVLALRASILPARDRTIYPFSSSGFSAPLDASRVPSQHFDVRNDAGEPLAFGLVAAGCVAGRTQAAPINAVVVPAGFTADFSARAEAYVWMDPEGAGSGTIVTVLPHRVTAVAIDEEHREVRLHYDGSTSMFYSIE